MEWKMTSLFTNSYAFKSHMMKILFLLKQMVKSWSTTVNMPILCKQTKYAVTKAGSLPHQILLQSVTTSYI